ncbi:Neuralized-like protein 4, partial [Orchesella cincta]
AERKRAETDFNEGVVFSESKLKTNTIFQVRLDRKVGFWSGGIQLGVTIVDPNELPPETVPQSATELRYGTWLMASKTILKDGEMLMENYGYDLENLQEGDTVGLMRTNQGALVYFIQGVSQGVAVPFVPEDVYVVINLYGKCAKVSVVDVQPYEQCSNTVEFVVHRETETETSTVETTNDYLPVQSMDNNSSRDKLRFHTKCGPLIRIDMLVHKWSGSIEFGLITHNPEEFNYGVDFPATLTVLRNGSVIMSGNGILHDGKATNSPYIGLNLDQLQEGDRLGVMKKSNGDVVYFVNGESQGVAASGMISQQVWGAVNLYGMCSRVTIVDRNDHEEYNLRLNLKKPQNFSSIHTVASMLQLSTMEEHAIDREASQDFNHGVVLTNRKVKSNEMFEVRLDKMVKKWAGSIEIGVTTHRPTSLEYPCTMTNLRSGTWMMTGNGIMHNGQSVIDEYGQSLDRLKVGDRVGVLRKENGDLHFYVNGVDQGIASSDVPEAVYGVIDLYGQAAQATIISHDNNYGDNCCNHDIDRGSTVCFGVVSTPSGDAVTVSGDLKFHSLHGKNARISNNGVTASRPNARGEFNAAIVVSNRPLRDNELFEVIIEKMVDRWSGNIESGVTTIRPENLLFPNTMTDIDHDTIMLSGSSIMSGGNTITTRYACNLDCLTVGSRVGMMRKSDNTLHFFINGEDMGVAANDVPQNIYAVVDLYGQCAQVSITRVGDASMVSSQVVESLISLPINDTAHRFSVCGGKHIVLKNNNLHASRQRHFNNALVFSSTTLEADELFEVRITEISAKWAGSLIIGVTALSIADDFPASRIPNRINGLNADTWFVKGCSVFKNQQLLKQNYCVNLNRLCLGDRVGIRIGQDTCLRLTVNGEDMGVAAFNLPKKLHAVLELYGSTTAVTITSSVKSIVASPGDSTPATGIAGSDSAHSLIDDSTHARANSSSHISLTSMVFGRHALNIDLSNGDMVARRSSGYQGIVFSSQPMLKGQVIQIQVDKLNPKWTSSIIVGVTEVCPDKLPNIPASSLSLKNGSWIVASDSLYENGVRVKDGFCYNLDNIQVGEVLSILLDLQGNVHLICNGTSAIIRTNVTAKIWLIVDLYGETEQVTLFTGEDCPKPASNINLIVNGNLDTSFCSDKGILSGDSSQCEYFQACQRFKSSLCLPESYFVPTLTEIPTCFCSKCMQIRGDEVVKEQGDPMEKHTAPRNWVRFPLNINFDVNNSSCDQSMMTGLMSNSTSSLSNVLTTWHVAFYGLPIYHVRQVMDYGQLRYPDVYSAMDEAKDEKVGTTELIFSPLIQYASLDDFASPKRGYFDSKTKQRLSVKTIFELLVQPGSYRTSPPSYPVQNLNHHEADKFDINHIEWSTKEQGATHVAALLLCLEGFTLE